MFCPTNGDMKKKEKQQIATLEKLESGTVFAWKVTYNQNSQS